LLCRYHIGWKIWSQNNTACKQESSC